MTGFWGIKSLSFVIIILEKKLYFSHRWKSSVSHSFSSGTVQIIICSEMFRYYNPCFREWILKPFKAEVVVTEVVEDIPRRRHNNGNQGRGSNAPRSNDDESNTLLSKLQREYNPSLILWAKWSAKEHYKVKVPHPYLQGEKETVNFPVFESGNSLSDRTLFHGEVLDLHENVGFDGNNGGLLYYTFRLC